MSSKLEQEMWLQIAGLGGQMPEPEYSFHPTRKWRFDFAWPGLMVAVEVHGGTRGLAAHLKKQGFTGQGRHNRPDGYATDREKMNEAALLGWLVIEVTAEHIKTGKALWWIEKALNLRAVQGDTR